MKEPLLLILCWIISAAVVVHAQHRFDCDPNYCSKKENQCSELNCRNGRVVPNATLCGCCDICVESLEEDAVCSNMEFGWSSNLKECGNGLFCNQTKCEPTKCLKHVREYNEENANYRLNVNFTCNYFGNYDPVVCIADILCFCVNKEGKRIFGTDIASNKNLMTCDCSRDITAFPKAVEDEAYLPRCLPSGDYDPLQCTKDKCFCMDSSNRKDVPNDDSSMRSLPCHDNIRHENGRETKCLREKKEQMELFKKNYTVIGIEPIRCDLDGSYFPVQCNPGRCFCVTKNGRIYENYIVEKKKAEKMTCRCVRDKEILRNIKDSDNIQLFEKLECDKFGNYNSESKTKNITKKFFKDFV